MEVSEHTVHTVEKTLSTKYFEIPPKMRRPSQKGSSWEQQLFEFDIEVPEVYPSIEAQMVSIVTSSQSTSRYDGSVEHWVLEY